MDKNSATGLFLISALLLIYLFFFAPKSEPEKAPAKPAATASTAPAKAATATPAPLDSAAMAQALGNFAAAAQGTAQDVQLANDDLTITFSTKGGQVQAVRINKYKTFFGQPFDLLDKESAKIDTRFRTTDGRTVRFSDLYFQPSAAQSVTEGNRQGQRLTFTAAVAGGQIEQVYTLYNDSYEVGYEMRFAGLGNVIAQEPMTLTFLDRVRQTEQDRAQNRNHTTINHYLANDDPGSLSETSEDPEEIVINEPVKWAAHKHDFFVAGLIAQNQFSTGKFNSNVPAATDSTNKFIKTLSTTLTVPAADVLGAKASFGIISAQIPSRFSRK
ncbi:membrane protein insertase YidC [Hymenobacter radiodurans]|uniref:membrane protein insertase YidC n=1 Tax=Hymenobacter radiodurans TaxID=2496028 RepID=UPI001F0E4949|nr:membrane protein insertase YidC [Hymenobacter radiodurans]